MNINVDYWQLLCLKAAVLAVVAQIKKIVSEEKHFVLWGKIKKEYKQAITATSCLFITTGLFYTTTEKTRIATVRPTVCNEEIEFVSLLAKSFPRNLRPQPNLLKLEPTLAKGYLLEKPIGANRETKCN